MFIGLGAICCAPHDLADGLEPAEISGVSRLDSLVAIFLPANKIKFEDQLAPLVQCLVGPKSDPAAAEVVQLAALGMFIFGDVLKPAVEEG